MCSSGGPLKEIAHDLGVATKMLRPGYCALHANIRDMVGAAHLALSSSRRNPQKSRLSAESERRRMRTLAPRVVQTSPLAS
jgi:uncharacterized protein YPO0396